MSQETTIHVKNISSQTSEKEVQDFFSFCGKISNLSVTSDGSGSQSAAVTFEKPTAAKTALLLDNTQLGQSIVNVSAAATLDELSGGPGQPASATHKDAGGIEFGDSGHISQEDKPKSRIVAEYLAHGYTISDKAIERAIQLDSHHGVSSRFTKALQDFDSKYKATEKAQSMDQQYGVSQKASSAFNTLQSYFEKAMGTPSGQRVRQFYLEGNKQITDVHNEARRLADLKAGRSSQQQGDVAGGSAGVGAPAGDTSTGPGVPSAADVDPREKMNMEKLPDSDRTRCTCAGETGSCPCEPGKCACASCAKNPDAFTPA